MSADVNHLTNQALPNNDQEVVQLKAARDSKLDTGAKMIGVVNTMDNFERLEANDIDAYFALWAVKEWPQETVMSERGVESFIDVLALIEKML